MPNPFDSVPPNINATYAVYPNPITINNTGSGLQSLNALTANAQLFDTTDDTNVTLAVSSVTDTHTFALGWTGTLAVNRGGTGASTANGSLNNLLPTQTGQSGKVLSTDGSNTSWVSAGGGGTVTSVALTVPNILSVSGSPVTGAGTLAVTLASQFQNLVLASPNGSSGTPSFRALVAADIPSLAASKITSGQLAIAQGGTGQATANAALNALLPSQGSNNGKVLTTNGTDSSWTTAATGTVTSVAASGTNGVSISGSPITTTGTITIGLSANGVALDRLAQIADQRFLGNISGGAANVIALTPTEVKTGLSLNLVENTALSTWAGSTNITTLGTIATGVWNGTPISVAKGGCGIASYAIGDMLYASATTTLSKLAGNITTTKKHLTQTGTGSASAAPVWETIAATDLTGTLLIAHGGTSATDANSALNNFLPDQSTSSGKFLTTDGANASWDDPPSGGTVTSVALTMPSILSVAGSPITISGILAVTLATQVANTIFSGPTTGADATPTFRALVAADIPNLAASKITSGTLAVARGGTNIGSYTKGDLLAASGAATLVNLGVGTNGQVLSADSGETSGLKWISVTGTGTVTSVGVSVSGGLSVSGTPVTASGTIAIGITTNGIAFGKISQIADGTLLGNNSGGTGDITALTASQAKVLLSLGNVENTALSTWGGSATISTVGTVSSGTWVGDEIDPLHGGTGITSYDIGDTLYAGAADTLTVLPGNITTDEMVLAQTGSGAASDAPEWVLPPQVIGGGAEISSLSGSGTGYSNPFGVKGGLSASNNLFYSFIAPKSMLLKSLYIRVEAAPGTGDTIVVTVLKNGVATALTATIAGNVAVSASDTTHTVSVSAGDRLMMQVDGTGTPASTELTWGFIG